MMKRKVAAEYLDLSEAAFEREVASARLPTGRMIGGREHWDKIALDRAIDALMGGGEPDWRSDLRKRYEAA